MKNEHGQVATLISCGMSLRFISNRAQDAEPLHVLLPMPEAHFVHSGLSASLSTCSPAKHRVRDCSSSAWAQDVEPLRRDTL